MDPLFTRKLPAIKTVKSSPVSSTGVKLIESFIDRFDIVPWNTFHAEARVTATTVSATLGPEELKNPKRHIDSLYRMTEPSFISDEARRRAKQLNMTGTIDSHNRTNIPMFPKPIVYPDELSMSGLFHNFFEAINSIVQMMTLSSGYKVISRRIKSEIQYLVELRNAQNRQEGGDDDQADEERSEDSSRSSGEESRPAMLANKPEQSAESPDDSMQDVDGPEQADTQSPNSSQQDDLKVRNKYYLPDYCLMHYTELDPRKGEVICCMEVKGPQKNVTGRYNEPARGPPGNVVRTEADLVQIPSGGIPDNAGSLADRLCSVMSTNCSGNLDPPGDQNHASVRKSLAQALSYVLETSSGLAYLWNWGDGVVLHVVPNSIQPDPATCKVAVVNETIDEEGEVGHVAAASHVCLHAVKQANDPQVKKAMKRLRDEIAESIVNGGEDDYVTDVNDENLGGRASASTVRFDGQGSVGSRSGIAREAPHPRSNQAATRSSVPGSIALPEISINAVDAGQLSPVSNEDITGASLSPNCDQSKLKLKMPCTNGVKDLHRKPADGKSSTAKSSGGTRKQSDMFSHHCLRLGQDPMR